MKYFKFILCLFFLLKQLNAQDFNNYIPLKSSGKIPLDFTVVSSEAYQEAKENIDQNQKRFERKSQKKFHLVNSFNLHELVYSGKLIFNDPLTSYANKVLDEVLKNDKSLRNQLRIYVVKTTYVNAFATNNGIILINEGLIAQLENEAQLAFILCHEITHFTKKHVMNQYVEKQKIITGRTDHDYRKSSEQLFAINKFSKETEKEADEVGLELYKKSNYDLNQLQGVFDVLEYAYLPFDEIEYDKSFLEFEKYKFPAKYYPDSLKKLPVEEDEDDSHSTHPSILKRRAYAERAIKGLSNVGRLKYITSTEKDFLKIRKIARYELVEEYIAEAKYIEALYCIYLLQKEEPLSNYLKKSKARCIYGIAKYKISENYSVISTSVDEVYGESQPLHTLFYNMPPAEVGIWAVKSLWRFSTDNKSEKFYKELTNDLIYDLSINHYKDLSEFKTSYPTITKKIDTLALKNDKASKYEKVKKKIENTNEVEGVDYYLYAFVDELNNSAFEMNYNTISKKAQADKNYRKSVAYKKETEKNEKRIRKKGYKLGVDKIVLASPFYLNIDERKADQVRYIDSEEAENNFLYILKDNAQLAGLQMDVLDDIDVKNVTTEKYNDFAYINDWFSQKTRENKYDVNLLDLNKEQTDEFIKKYNTKYVCWMGTVAVREKKEGAAYYVLLSIMCYPAAPFLLPKVFTPEYDTYFYSIVYDIEKREHVAFRYDKINRNDSKGQINSIVYDTFHQIKEK